MQAVAQLAAALGFALQALDMFDDEVELFAQGLAAQRIQRFVGEIDGRFHVHADRQHRVHQRLDTVREHAVERAPRGACGLDVAGGDQVGDGFGLGKVELAVEEGALAELARLRLPRAELDATRHQLAQQHRAAMRLQFDHVLAGIAGRRLEIQGDAVVDGVAGRIGEGRVVRGTRCQRLASDDFGHRFRPRSGQPHDADAASARRCGDGDDGVGFAHACMIADARNPPCGGLRGWRDCLRAQAFAGASAA